MGNGYKALSFFYLSFIFLCQTKEERKKERDNKTVIVVGILTFFLSLSLSLSLSFISFSLLHLWNEFIVIGQMSTTVDARVRPVTVGQISLERFHHATGTAAALHAVVHRRVTRRMDTCVYITFRLCYCFLTYPSSLLFFIQTSSWGLFLDFRALSFLRHFNTRFLWDSLQFIWGFPRHFKAVSFRILVTPEAMPFLFK